MLLPMFGRGRVSATRISNLQEASPPKLTVGNLDRELQAQQQPSLPLNSFWNWMIRPTRRSSKQGRPPFQLRRIQTTERSTVNRDKPSQDPSSLVSSWVYSNDGQQDVTSHFSTLPPRGVDMSLWGGAWHKRRALVGTITTTECPSVRTSDSFRARLDLMYLYQVEYTTDLFDSSSSSTNEEPDLPGIERAVAMALASALDQCDAQGRPAYAIQISATQGHEVTPGE